MIHKPMPPSTTGASSNDLQIKIVKKENGSIDCTALSGDGDCEKINFYSGEDESVQISHREGNFLVNLQHSRSHPALQPVDQKNREHRRKSMKLSRKKGR